MEILNDSIAQDSEKIKFKFNKSYTVMSKDAFVRFDGEPDSNGNLHAFHEENVYRLSIKPNKV